MLIFVYLIGIILCSTICLALFVFAYITMQEVASYIYRKRGKHV